MSSICWAANSSGVGSGGGAGSWDEAAPELAAGKPVMAFGDYSYYNIGDRGSRSMQELRELFAGNGMIGYVAKERVDGLLVLPEAVQILKAGASA